MLKAAEAHENSGDKPGAKKLWAILAEIPGDGAEHAKARRDGKD